MNPGIFAKAADLFTNYMLKCNVTQCHRRGTKDLEKAVDKLHGMIKNDPRLMWAFFKGGSGGNSGRAWLRGGLIAVVGDKVPETADEWAERWFKTYDKEGCSWYYGTPTTESNRLYAVYRSWTDLSGSGDEVSTLKLFRDEKDAILHKNKIEKDKDFTQGYHFVSIHPIKIN